jgi:hypothetical protein
LNWSNILSGTPTGGSAPRGSRSLAGILTLAFAMLLAGACGRKIGDACSTSNDCDPTTGTRSCDLSQPGGYCVLEGCDARSCPEDSFCARFFPATFLNVSCGPGVAGVEMDDPNQGCAADELCVPVDKTPDNKTNVCARRSLEKRVCVQSCGGDGDCRGEYTCRATGQGGVLALTLTPASTPRFCAPK